ncbi:MAG: filamentous hemagglutinin N-terminal domain-containing protein [Scytonematopsis contorta HA4267-MV1]|nr:filamentous hemagglutinin N-terminal domain-containing protein [Scytonematopsis contorta HA4267-MV1]
MSMCDTKNTLAQVVPDATLPPRERTQISSPDSNVFRIDGGAVRSGNLFHSFENFSVPTNGEAFFNNPTNISNIISRVTGDNASNIDGLLRANGNANLFLLNPNGIIFGQNAKLSIGGSFIGSTATSINFADGFKFSTTKDDTSPLLTISVPVGLQFGANPGNITDFSRSSSVSPEKTLALVGGKVTIDGGNLMAPSGRIELGSVAENNTVSLTPSGSGWKLGYQGVSAFQDIRLINSTRLNADGNGTGSISITGNNIDVLNNSIVRAETNTNSQPSDYPAGGVILDAKGTIAVKNDSVITSQVRTVGNAGNINIQARSLQTDDGAKLVANNLGQGNAGNVTINVIDDVSLDGLTNPQETVMGAAILGKGNGGQITINAARMSLKNGANVVAHTFGEGDAGKIEVNTTDAITIDGVSPTKSGFSSGVGSQVFPNAMGKGGTIILNAPSVTVSNGGNVVAHTRGRGDAGSVTINANKISIDGVGINGESSGLGSAVFESATGKAGQIFINTDSLSVTNSASLLVASLGKGDAGSVIINAKGDVVFDGVGSNGRSSSAFSTVERGSTGDGKEIKITANSLTVSNGAVIAANTRGLGKGGNIDINVNRLQVFSGGQVLATSRDRGDSGNITVNASDQVILSGSDPNFLERLALAGRPIVRNQGSQSGLYADTDGESTGKGGNINVNTHKFLIADDALVDTSAFGSGTTGDINITVSDLLKLDRGGIRALSLLGQGGNIRITASGIILGNQSTISTRTGTEQSGGGDGGDITINSDVLTALQNSNINANAFQGRGGNIQIISKGVFVGSGSGVTASSQTGINGIVDINTPDVDPSKSAVELPLLIIDPAKLVANSCIARRERTGGSFIVTGGVPTLPDDLASSPFPTLELQPNSSTSFNSFENNQNQDIAEADNIYQLENGDVVLGRRC